MEFVIVLPIYMLLLGFVFVMGELALQTIRLSGGADRTYAMVSAAKRNTAFTMFKRAISPHDARDTATENKWDVGDYSAVSQSDIKTYEYQNEKDYSGGSHALSAYVSSIIETNARTGKDGETRLWTKAVATKVTDNYTLTPLTRELVAFWYWEVDQRQKRTRDAEILDVDKDEFKALDDILNTGIGRTQVKGKLLDGRQYGYYCLLRNDSERGGQRYRARNAGDVVKFWDNMVKNDAVAPYTYDEIEGGGGDVGLDPGSPGDFSLRDKQFHDSWTR